MVMMLVQHITTHLEYWLSMLVVHQHLHPMEYSLTYSWCSGVEGKLLCTWRGKTASVKGFKQVCEDTVSAIEGQNNVPCCFQIHHCFRQLFMALDIRLSRQINVTCTMLHLSSLYHEHQVIKEVCLRQGVGLLQPDSPSRHGP